MIKMIPIKCKNEKCTSNDTYYLGDNLFKCKSCGCIFTKSQNEIKSRGKKI